jgi:hypothetical protein
MKRIGVILAVMAFAAVAVAQSNGESKADTAVINAKAKAEKAKAADAKAAPDHNFERRKIDGGTPRTP